MHRRHRPLRAVEQHVPGQRHDRPHRRRQPWGAERLRGAQGCGSLAQHRLRGLSAPSAATTTRRRRPASRCIPDDKHWNAFAKGTFQLNDDWQADLTGIYAQDESHLIIQPGPISNVFTFGPDLTPGRSRCSRRVRSIRMQKRPRPASTASRSTCAIGRYENGNRDTTDTNEHGQLIAGVMGSVKDWDVDVSVLLREGKTTEHVNGGFQDYRLLMPLLNSGTVNLFGFNTPGRGPDNCARPISSATRSTASPRTTAPLPRPRARSASCRQARCRWPLGATRTRTS